MSETLATLSETANIAETLAREMKEPRILLAEKNNCIIALPPAWSKESIDLEKLLPAPRRKIAKVTLTDADTYIDYIKRHGSLAYATLWCKADFVKGNLGFTAILNDHGEEEEQQNWRDHQAIYIPEKSVEWQTWIDHDGPACGMSQIQFALFLEDNLKDIASTADDLPTGGAMLQMAIDFEAKQDMRLKSAVRLQSGGVRMEYVEDEDKNTVAAMKVFERFQIGIPVLRDDTERYPITARLRYRHRDGKLTFWYELIRPDLIMERSAKALVSKIKDGAGVPFFFGFPFTV